LVNVFVKVGILSNSVKVEYTLVIEVTGQIRKVRGRRDNAGWVESLAGSVYLL